MEKSRLVLGTVQLGMPYGVSNAAGQPDREVSFAILDAALEGGINTFDTASAYGGAEAILGEWITSRGHTDSVQVISKGASQSIETEIEASLQRLHLERLDGYLLHSASDMHKENMISGLRVAKDRGLIGNIGVSIYEPQEAEDAVGMNMEYVQIPYNVLDQRLGRDFFLRAKENRVTIFARSPFLQGLVLMQPDTLPAHVAHARPYVDKFVTLSKKYGLTQLEAALHFTLANEHIDHVVFGVVSVPQLQEIFAAARADTPSQFVAEAREMLREVPYDVVDPRLWKKAA